MMFKAAFNPDVLLANKFSAKKVNAVAVFTNYSNVGWYLYAEKAVL